MINLYNDDTNALLGAITENDLQLLIDVLEEESETDQSYYIDLATIELIGDEGRATDHLLNLLRSSLGNAEGVNVRWARTA